MGIAKTMNAIGDYSFYTNDYIEFAKNLCTRFEINLEVYFVDLTSNYAANDKNDEFIDFKFSKTYKLAVSYYDYDEDKPDPKNIYCTYEMFIPVDLKYEKELILEFLPNGIFQLCFLPFSNAWRFFIEDIQGINDHYYKSHLEVDEQIQEIRNCYISILKKIDSKEVIIWTHANYKTEDEFLFNQAPNKVDTLDDIKEAIKKLDNITLYNFIDSIKQINKFDNQSDLEIAFIDKFEDN